MTAETPDILARLLDSLPALSAHHARHSPVYPLLEAVARREVQRFGDGAPLPAPLGPFGLLDFPFTAMGAVTSVNLFDPDELILFSYYWLNRAAYRRVADIGANLGLHSIILARCGFEIRCYEPDPHHFALLTENLRRNGCDSVTPINAAVSSAPGEMEFVRLLGNTTGSHLAGAKANPYGEIERFPVRLEAIAPILAWADLIKMDVEGHEREILVSTSAADWVQTDAFLEIGTAENGLAIFEHMRGLGVKIFAQKLNWGEVLTPDAMPTSYREGSVFLTVKPGMNWTIPA